MDIIKSTKDLEKFKDYENKILKFERAVKFKIDVFLGAGWSIEAGEYIKAGGSIEAGGYIKAGEYIEAGEYIFSYIFLISAKLISTKKLPFWREFYSEMPPLKKWKYKILSDLCWDDLKYIPTADEAKQICSWDGWHWIIRGQLECFFGLKKSFKPPVL